MQIKVDGMKNLERALLQDAAKRMENPRAIKGHSVVVGYTAAYALYVHENLEMKWKGKPRGSKEKPRGKYWDPQGRGQSKFLEKPARELTNDGTLKRIVAEACHRGVRIQQALAMAALRIQRESQKIVPVDTGNLKASAFTRKE